MSAASNCSQLILNVVTIISALLLSFLFSSHIGNFFLYEFFRISFFFGRNFVKEKKNFCKYVNKEKKFIYISLHSRFTHHCYHFIISYYFNASCQYINTHIILFKLLLLMKFALSFYDNGIFVMKRSS